MPRKTVYNVFVNNPNERIADHLNEISSIDPTFKPLLPTHLYVTKQQKLFIDNYVRPNTMFRFNHLKESLKQAFPKNKISSQILSAYLEHKGYARVNLSSRTNKSLTFWKHNNFKL